jgi:anti-sigma regulatory factor (Ser/Thr protein kinase)
MALHRRLRDDLDPRLWKLAEPTDAHGQGGLGLVLMEALMDTVHVE